MVSKAGSGIAVWFGLNAGGAVFIGVWAYAMMSNDWVTGLIFGWIPASIMGVIAGLAVFALTHVIARLVTPQRSASKAPPSDPPSEIPAH